MSVKCKQALIVQGGWEGHEPLQVAHILANLLREENFEVQISDTLDCFQDAELLQSLDLIVPLWTMGTIQSYQLNSFLRSVKEAGTGVAGLHGGMGDAFRNEPEYQYMVGGQWVAHPGNDGVTYSVYINNRDHVITSDIEDFSVTTEQYYMHVDPAIHVLATTRFKEVEMPVAWTKSYGQGKVFYCSLGHHADIVSIPQVSSMMRRGMVWAAR